MTGVRHNREPRSHQDAEREGQAAKPIAHAITFRDIFAGRGNKGNEEVVRVSEENAARVVDQK